MSLQSTWRCISALTGLATLFSTVQMYFVLTEYLQVYICSSRLADTNLCCTVYLHSTHRCISALADWPTLFSAVHVYNVLTEYLQVYLCSCRLPSTIFYCTDVQYTHRVLAGVSQILMVGQQHSLLYICRVYLHSTFRFLSPPACWPSPFSAVQRYI